MSRNSLHQLFNLDGKVAFVTGASYGLGATFSKVLSEAGAKVVLAARSQEKLLELQQCMRAKGGQALALRCDVTQPDQVETAVARAWEHFGRIDIMVNNVGQAGDAIALPENLPHDLFEQTVDVNLLGVWYCCREAGRRMLADGKTVTDGPVVDTRRGEPRDRPACCLGA